MKRLMLAALAVVTLFAGDTLAQQRPADTPPAAPQAVASAPAQPAQAVTDTMVANCLNETLALSENAAFAASPRTQPVGASLKLAPCAGGATVELRPVARIENRAVHDSAWRQVADALQVRANAPVRASAPVQERVAPATPEHSDTTEINQTAVIMMVLCLVLGLLLGSFVTYMVMDQKRPKRRPLNQIGSGGEVTPRETPAFQDDVALSGRAHGHGQSEETAPTPRTRTRT